MSRVIDRPVPQCLVLPALAALLFIPKLASGQQVAPLYVQFDFGKSDLHTKFDAGRQRTEASLSQKLLAICDSDLNIWNFGLAADKYPRLHAWLERTDADLRLHIDLDSDPATLLKPIEVQNRLIWTFGPDDLSPAILENKIVEAFREELRTEDNWSKFLERIKVRTPIGHLQSKPLVVLNWNGRIGGELPLDYQRFRGVAASQFLIVCNDDRGAPQQIICSGSGRTKSASIGLSPWIVRVFYLKLGSQSIDPSSLPVLRTLKGKTVYLAAYQSNPFDDDDNGSGMEIASLAADRGGIHP